MKIVSSIIKLTKREGGREMIRSLLFVLILCSFQSGVRANYYKPIKWIKQGEFVMDLIQDGHGVSVNKIGKSQKRDGSIIDMINCSYFWIASGRYWPVGLVRSGGKDRTSLLTPARGYAYFADGKFQITWSLPPKGSTIAFQGHIIILDGKKTKKNGGFNSYHWKRNCPRSIVAIRRDRYGIEYVGIVRAYGSLAQISQVLIKEQRVVAAVNNDGGSSTIRTKPVANVLIIRAIDKRIVRFKKDFGLI